MTAARRFSIRRRGDTTIEVRYVAAGIPDASGVVFLEKWTDVITLRQALIRNNYQETQ